MEKSTLIGYNDSENKPVALVRHELRIGNDDPVIKDLSEELIVDKELGLTEQAEITMTKALQHDIDELTSSNDYFEVDQNTLKKLFQINNLRRKCLWSNIISAIKGFIVAGFLPLSLHMFVLASIYPMIMYSQWIWTTAPTYPTSLLVLAATFNVISWIGIIVILFWSIFAWSGKRIKYSVLEVDIDMKPLKSVRERIPYGAKLKVLESSKKGIFVDFVYATPKFDINDTLKEINFPKVDPAILGVTLDKRMYMIVYWDIEKDIAKVVKQINHFKKFKLNKNI